MGEPLNIRSERDFSEADSALVPKRRELELPTCSETRRGRIAPRAIVGDQGAQTGRIIRLAAGKEAPTPAAGKLRGGERTLPPPRGGGPPPLRAGEVF